MEGLNLPRALGERLALHRLAERVPSYRGLNQASAGRGRNKRSVKHERAAGPHLLVELGPSLKSDSSPLAASASAHISIK